MGGATSFPYPALPSRFQTLLYAPRPGAVEGLGTAHAGGGCDQSIESTVSHAVVRSWLWLTAISSSPLGCFSTLL